MAQKRPDYQSIPELRSHGSFPAFKVEGEKLTGKAKSQFGDIEIIGGKFKDDEITFIENVEFNGTAIRIDYKGKVAGDEIKFTRQVGEFGAEEFVAKRVK